MSKKMQGQRYGIPPRKVNGGLYTGEPFASAGWANVPVRPEAGHMQREALRIGNEPPAGASLQYVCTTRPGNSDPDQSGLVADDETGFAFIPCPSR